MSLFEKYEQDYANLSSSITKKLNGQLPQATGEAKKTLVRALENDFEEAAEILQGMGFELTSMPPATRTRLQSKLNECKADCEKLKSQFKAAKAQSAERNQLLGDSDSINMDATSMDQRSRLLAGTHRLNDASRRLEESHRIAIETENIGASTLQTLRGQREQIMRANDSLDETNTYIDRNVRLLKNMARRLATNRVLSYGIIAALVFIILLILFIKFA